MPNVQWMPYSFVQLYFFECDVCAQLYMDESKKIFDHFICFWKWFFNWNIWYSKNQRIILNIEISKISSTDLKMRCIVKKWSNVMICKEAKWKASKIVIIFLWEVIYVHFYNWDRLLVVVLVMYNLIELIIEALL